MGLFSRRAPEAPPVVAVFHLNARLQPMHRGSVYEDPLDELLAKHAPGSEVVGGGTEFDQSTGPLSCDTEVQLSGDPAETFQTVIDILEHLGAPVGSWGQLGDAPQVSFGRTHGLALSLDGSTLPDEVYAENDINEVIGALVEELGDDADLQSWWEGPERTSLYFYAEDAERLRAVLSSADGRFALAQNSMVEAITD